MAGMARAEPEMSNAAEKKRQSYKYYNQRYLFYCQLKYLSILSLPLSVPRSQLDFYPEQTDGDDEQKSKAMIQKTSDM